MDDKAYQIILELYKLEGNITWSRYNVMLVANSIILGGIALLLQGSHLFLPLVLMFGGFLTCILWHRLTTIGFGMFYHYFKTACEHEEKLQEADRVLTEASKKPWGIWNVLMCAKAVIWIFLVIYGFVALWLIIKFFCSRDICRWLTS
jgi:hypothetical protein